MIVFLTKAEASSVVSGRERLTRDLLRIIRKVDQRVQIRFVPAAGPPSSKLLNAITGYVDGATRSFADELVDEFESSGVRTLFVDGSNFGRLVERVKKALPAIRIITFFHNCETAFFWGSIKSRRSLKSALVLVSNYLAERNAVRFSDDVVTLTERDGDLLRRIYGRGQSSTFPMFLARERSTGDHDRLAYRLPGGVKYVLFVGGAFYANVSGVSWFAREVSPHLPFKTLIVGAGFEKHRPELEQHENVIVVGRVEDLRPYYEGAALVVAPIFDGSGMKTKVAEALMFGKVVIGTPESFVGYERPLGSVCISCSSASEFIFAIQTLAPKAEQMRDDALAFFASEFSEAAAMVRMKALLIS
jgi:glycosyltransferase involved in cell wall biosynthesis